MSALKELDFS